jgi:hypothetical protein
VRGGVRSVVGLEGHSDWFAEVEILSAAEKEEVPSLGLADLLALVGHRLYAI